VPYVVIFLEHFIFGCKNESRMVVRVMKNVIKLLIDVLDFFYKNMMFFIKSRVVKLFVLNYTVLLIILDVRLILPKI
jgi:hypothetical protein